MSYIGHACCSADRAVCPNWWSSNLYMSQAKISVNSFNLHMVECRSGRQKKKQQQFTTTSWHVLTSICFDWTLLLDTMSSPVYKPKQPRVFFIARLASSGKYWKVSSINCRNYFWKIVLAGFFTKLDTPKKCLVLQIWTPTSTFCCFKFLYHQTYNVRI